MGHVRLFGNVRPNLTCHLRFCDTRQRQGPTRSALGCGEPRCGRGAAPPAVFPSPEAEACRAAHARMAAQLVRIAARSTNLARLYSEYRRTVRRVRALQDVLLPEVESALATIESSLEELEQDEFGFLRRAVRAAQASH
ncbi:hypothetical protein FBR04_12230 [Betaproteobacteria bacterium PRO7]|nr:hypothetical protein [Betaproteobacteria bacterium PRO7]